MEKLPLIVANLRAWFEEFGHALESWEGWLARVEQAYITGVYAELNALEVESKSIQGELAKARDSRRELLALAAKQGFSGTSVTGLVRWLSRDQSTEYEAVLTKLNQQLCRAQQMSTCSWVTGFQAASYTSALLEILATGNADRATYGTCEREVLEGGHIVDAAA